MSSDTNEEYLNKPLETAPLTSATAPKFSTQDYPPFGDGASASPSHTGANPAAPPPPHSAPSAASAPSAPYPASPAAAVPPKHPGGEKDGKRKGCSCTVVSIVLLVLALLVCIVVICVLSIDNAAGPSGSHSVDSSFPSYSYKLIAPATKDQLKQKIVVLPIEGVISSSRGDGIGAFCTPEDLRSALDYLAKDDSIIAVVLEVNSPGGGLTASDIMLHYLRNFKFKTELPIYAYFMDEACSGGYYISMAADEIYACPTTMTGSIGVIMQLPEITGLMNKVGVKMVTITSLNSEGKASYKDIGSMYRTMKPNERAMLQSMITESWQGFVQVVSEGRKGKLTKQQVAKLADGRIFSAKQAQKAKIIDGICYPDDLYLKIAQKLHDKISCEPCVVRLTRDTSYMDIFSSLGIRSALDPFSRAPQLPAGAQLPQRYYRSQYDGIVQ